MTKKIYLIHIELKYIKPKIWRKIVIPSDLLLTSFHKVIQTTMGWTNSHLHHFKKDGMFYSVQNEDDDFWDEMDTIDYKKKKMRVSDLLKVPKEKVIYEYDFGDSWEHEIVLQKIFPFDNLIKLPFCVDGKMNCPPEDCGGVWGYMEIIKILKRPNHEEYESIIEWLGGGYDADYFDEFKTTEMLLKKNYGCR